MFDLKDVRPKGFKRTRRVNGERIIEFTAIPFEENKSTFDLIVEEASVNALDDKYIIKRLSEQSRGKTYIKNVTAIHKFFVDLINKQQPKVHNGSITFNNYMNLVFEDTGYTFIAVDSFSAREFENLGNDNRLALLQKGLERWGAEFELVGNQVRFYHQIGNDTDFQFRYGHNIKAINVDIDTTNLATRIRGTGDPELGIEAEYISPNSAIYGIIDAPPVNDERFKYEETLLEEMKRRLQDEPEISITVDFVDLRAAGYPYTVPNEGDRVWLIYEPMNDLLIETRIVEIVEHFRYDEENNEFVVIKTEVTLSNHKKTFAGTMFDNIRKQLRQIVNDDGIIKYSALDGAVRIATEALHSAQTELEFNNGIIAREKTDPNKLVVLNSAGIGVSNDGGTTFRTAITGNGVAAETLVGKILTGSLLTIENENGLFRFDKDGFVAKTSATIIENEDGTNKLDEIELKANKTDVYTKTQVDQELGKKVDTTVYNQKIGELTTSIDGISANVSNLQTTVGQHGTSISNLQSQVDIQAGQIASKVDATYVQNAIADIQVGGRNYFPFTELDASYATEINVDAENGIISGTTSWAIAWRNKILEPNQEYTISVKQIINKNPDFPDFVRFRLYNVKADKYHPTKDIYSNSTYTFKTDSEDEYTLLFYVVWGDEKADFSIEKLKLDKGNKATDWTPAPEDVQSQIDGLGSRITTAETSITQLSNQIALKANQSTVDTLTGQVSNLQSQLTVHAEQIATKVEKNGVISAINQTAEQIKIQASKVDLAGYVTFTNLSTPGQTTIDGGNITSGYISADRIAANSITADKLNVTSLSAISADLGEVTAGTIRGVSIYGSTIEGVILRSSDAPDFFDPNYTERAELRSGYLTFESKGVLDEYLKLRISGVGLLLQGYPSDISIPSEYTPSSQGSMKIHNGFIQAVDSNRESSLFINAKKVGIGVPLGGSARPSFEFLSGILPEDATFRIGSFSFESNLLSNYLTFTGGGLEIEDDIIFSAGHGRVVANSSATYIQNNTEIRATKYKSTTYVPVRASTFPTASLAEYKEDIHPWQESALEKIRQATIYEYYLKSEFEQGVYRKRQGLVVGEGYNTPAEVIDGDGIEQYLMNAWSWKAIQELDSEQMKMRDEIEWLKLENQYLKQKIKELEDKIA